jgi:hypothetical protein
LRESVDFLTERLDPIEVIQLFSRGINCSEADFVTRTREKFDQIERPDPNQVRDIRDDE